MSIVCFHIRTSLNKGPGFTVYANCALPPQVDEAEVLVADTSGENVANKTRLELIRQQEELIQKEAEEKAVEVRIS